MSSNVLAKYKNIISISPHLTEYICNLGAEDILIAHSVYYKNDSKKCYNKKIIYNLVNPSTEILLKLKSDLIISGELNSIKLSNRFNIKKFKNPKNSTQIYDNLLKIANLINKTEYAKKLIENTKKFVKSIKKNNLKILIQISTNPIFIASNNFLNDYIKLSGSENIIFNLKNSIVSKEFLLKKSNKGMLIIAMNKKLAEIEKKKLQNYGLKNINIIDEKILIPNIYNMVFFIKEIQKYVKQK